MKVLMASPEVTPFAKTGGLADVVGALPKYLSIEGVECAVVMPLHRLVKQGNFKLKSLDTPVKVNIGDEIKVCQVMMSNLPDSKVPIYFLRMDDYYDRDGLYGNSTGDHKDNCERFVFFARGVLEMVKALKLKFDVIHSHDWQSALIPVYMRTLYRRDFANVKSVVTIHNLAYQGLFWHWDMNLTGLGWEHFNWKELEFYGKMNFLKGGLVFSDAITTVSKTYAEEIKTEEFGCGLEGVLRERSDRLFGIINGIDYSDWNPATDKLIPANFSPEDLKGKAICKAKLQERCGLKKDQDVPLVGLIGRLAEQKGIDIFMEIVDRFFGENLQLVILGSGDKRYQDELIRLGTRYKDKLSINITFDNKLAHMIEAGADIFLMPSRFEPCGLNQLYSLKYGTVPVVNRTGGLADTITDSTTGFVFTSYDGASLYNAIKRALDSYKDRQKWRKIMLNGMKQDWSWSRSALEYETLYKKL